MTALEKEVEEKLRKMVESHGGKCLKWVCPGWRGVPDRIVIMPSGRIYFVELKRPKDGQYSRMQDWWRDQLIVMGCRYYRIQDWGDVAWFETVLYHDQGGRCNA